MFQTALLCNNAKVNDAGDLVGQPTEGALVVLATKVSPIVTDDVMIKNDVISSVSKELEKILFETQKKDLHTNVSGCQSRVIIVAIRFVSMTTSDLLP